MKLSKNQIRIMYSYQDPDLDIEDDFWPIMGVLITILGLWTGFVHFIDAVTMDMIPWWVEPFTIAPFMFLLIMKERWLWLVFSIVISVLVKYQTFMTITILYTVYSR